MRRGAIFVVLLALLAVPGSASAQGCITKLPVSHSFKSNYAPSYRGKTMTVRVTSQGSWIHHVKAEIYTFSGELVAKSKIHKGGFNTTRALRMRLVFGQMQAGKYTLIVTGEPNTNRSCGPKKYTRVVQFYECPKSLPIKFQNLPQGKASDYGRWLQVNMESVGGVLHHVVVELYDFDNNLFARKKLKALFGVAQVQLKLRHKLRDGGYSLIVDADKAVPRACGHVKTKKVLKFGVDEGGGSDDGGDSDESFDPDGGFGTDGGDGTEA